jgi:hypothetical protein
MMSQRASASLSLNIWRNWCSPTSTPAYFGTVNGFVAHAHSIHAVQNEIKLFRADVFVQRVRALGRTRQSLAPSFSLLVHSRKSAFVIFIKLARRQWKSSGVIKN